MLRQAMIGVAPIARARTASEKGAPMSTPPGNPQSIGPTGADRHDLTRAAAAHRPRRPAANRITSRRCCRCSMCCTPGESR